MRRFYSVVGQNAPGIPHSYFRARNKRTGYIEPPSVLYDGQEIITDKKYFEKLELNTAESLAVLSNSKECVISEKAYGKDVLKGREYRETMLLGSLDAELLVSAK